MFETKEASAHIIILIAIAALGHADQGGEAVIGVIKSLSPDPITECAVMMLLASVLKNIKGENQYAR